MILVAESNLDFIKYKELESEIFEIKVGQAYITTKDDIDNLKHWWEHWWEEYNLIDLRIPYQYSKYIRDIYCGYLDPEPIYVSSICTYEMNSNTISHHPNIRLSSLGAIDFEECIKITRESFIIPEDSCNRFNLDYHFDENQIEKYYIRWTDNIFSYKNADDVYIYEEGDHIMGFIAFKKDGDDSWNIPLVGVERNSRNKGIYTEMLKIKDGAINTRAYLGNIGVEKAWLGMGGHIKGMEHVFHLWR